MHFRVSRVDATHDGIRKIGENMHRKNVENCYEERIAEKYVTKKKPFINVSSEIEIQHNWVEGKPTKEVVGYIINVSSEIEIQHNWVEGKPTKEVVGYKLFFAQEGVNPFAVKFAEKPELPKFLSEVTLEKLEAIEIRSKVYFRAESVVEKK